MKFSIIIPAYNVADYLENCVESILKQTYDNYEIIIVDDGSTDETGKVADELLKQSKQINVVHQSNGGASKARNTGMKRATGDYILFLDGDDFWSDSHFLKHIAHNLVHRIVSLFRHRIVNQIQDFLHAHFRSCFYIKILCIF